MSAKSLSVVMPNYNHGRYIGEALESIVTQSFAPKEVVVVDDASTDDSVEKIQPFVERYPFVRLVRNERNLGAPRAINRGHELITGDYVFTPAADDKALPGFFEKSMALLERHPRAGFCCARARLLGVDGEDLGPYHTPLVSDSPRYFSPEEILALYLRHGSWFVTFSMIFRRDALREVGGYDEALGPTADGLLIHVLSRRYGACFVPEPLVLWRKADHGFAQKQSADPELAWKTVAALDRRLTSPPFQDLFPPEYLTLFRRQALFAIIYELSRRAPHGHDRIAAAARLLAEPDAVDRAFLAALPHLGAQSGRLATKFYLFTRQPPASRRRIVGEKLRRLFPGQ